MLGTNEKLNQAIIAAAGEVGLLVECTNSASPNLFIMSLANVVCISFGYPTNGAEYAEIKVRIRKEYKKFANA